MARSYDFEWVLADAIAAWLTAQLDAATTANCPVVSFYDPMAVDDANRIVVLPESGNNSEELPACYTFRVTVTVKSLWTQPTLAADATAHRTRTHEVRNQLMSAGMAAGINVRVTDGKLVVDRVPWQRGFQMDTNEHYMLSETTFPVECHSA